MSRPTYSGAILDYGKLMTALSTLTHLEEMDRVQITRGTMEVDRSAFPSVTRFLRGHSRQDLVFFMGIVAGEAERMAQELTTPRTGTLPAMMARALEEYRKAVALLEEAAAGLEKVARTTYHMDGDTRETLLLFVARLRATHELVRQEKV